LKILFDIGHPAHVHLFRNFIKYLRRDNNSIFVVSRQKDVTNILLEHYQIDYICLSKPRKNIFGIFMEMIERDRKIYQLHKKNNFSISMGTSVSIAHLTALSNVPSFNFNEDDDSSAPIYSFLAYPFTTKIMNPTCIRYNLWKNKRAFIPSYHELAYLHPNNFSPDLTVLEKYGLKEKDYIVARFSALQAHHDIGQKGISNSLWGKIKEVCLDYQIVTSVENNMSHQIDPWDLHHVLAFSKLLITDSQTMTVEGAVLGIPSIKVNSFKDMSSVINELERRYKLSIGYLPEEETKVLNTIERLLKNNDIESIWVERKEKMLREKVDFNQWLIEYFENELVGYA
tara:strand:- start:51 stop:1076 length:1026 start_codon:yes stop_codon:yes gene_type:complete